MLYVDAQDISSVVEKAYDVRGLDRNGIVCDNILALASNPATVFAGTQLSPDFDYDPGKTWWEKITSAIHNWWRSIPAKYKAATGVILIILSLALACATGGMSVLAAAAKAALVELSIGIGFATVGWAIGSAISGDWSLGELENDIADAVFFVGVFMFIAASINAIKYAYRTRAVQEYSPEFLEWLNDGEANNIVYKGVTKQGDEVYTGITMQDKLMRLRQHQRAGKPFTKLETLCGGLTRNQARAIETYKILYDGRSQLNKILSISRRRKIFNEAMKWAEMFLGG